MTDIVNKRRWLKLAGLISIPVYAAPVGLWGIRGLRPRVLQNAASGAITLGMLSLAAWALSQWSRSLRASNKSVRPKERRWQLPAHEPMIPDDAIASATSGY